MKIKIPTINKYTIEDILTYPSLINPIWLLILFIAFLYLCTCAWFSVVKENKKSYLIFRCQKSR